MELLINWSVQIAAASAQGAGKLGEKIAASLFDEAGFWTAKFKQGTKCGDLEVYRKDTGEKFKVEVKTARKDKEGHYQFCLKRDQNMTDCKYADYVLLLAAMDSGVIVPFLIPVTAIGKQKKFTIQSNPLAFGGNWSKYRFDLNNLFTFWEIVARYEMLGGTPFTISSDLKFAGNICGSISIVVENEI